MSISQATLDRIRELVPLHEYFRDWDVHKEGPRWVCNCPYHTNSGKSRTLTLFPDGKAKCWSCGWHGDIFDACMSSEGVEWADAVERLAKRAGIQVERTGRDASTAAVAERSRRSAAWAAAEWATGWMHDQLTAQPEALGYLLVERKIPREVVDRWRLGWAPGDRLIPAAKDAGHSIEALRDAGLVVEKEEGRLRSFFFERITIPITNANGRVINWTARALPGPLKEAAQAGRHLPKYINGGETCIYAKRKALLGLRAALPHIVRHQAIIVVEGALDVIALDCLGVPAGCACCGTAMGEDQASALIDLSQHHEVPIVLLYDGDGAGSTASQRTAELLFKLGGRARVAMLPGEVNDPHGGTAKVKDCGDLWQALGQAGGAAITAAIAASVPAWDYLVERACPAPGAADIDARLIAADKLLAVVNLIEDDERRDMALAAAAERLGLTRAQLVRRSDRQRDQFAHKGPSDPQSAGNSPEGGWGFRIPPPTPEALNPPGKEQDFELNEMGNALRFAAHFGTRVRYVANWESWIIWTGTHWTIDRNHQAQRWMMDAIDASCRAEAARAWDKSRAAPKNSRDAADWTQRAIELERWRIKNLNARSKGNSLDMAACLRCLVCVSAQLDADPYLFACKNGWVDLRTGTLSPHDATLLYTCSCPIEYDADARDERWERYLVESSGNKPAIIGFLRRFAGYCATGDTSEQALTMISGPGGTGKSLFSKCLMSILGSYAYAADFSVFLASNNDKVKWTLANLEKARLVVCEESGEGRRFSADIVKQVTGGTPIEAQAKGKQPYTYQPLFKIVLVTNHPPRVSDRDDGFWRRMKLVRFDTIPAKRDKHLAEHLLSTRTAQQAILAWIVAGAQEWHRDGLAEPPEIAGANAQYREDQNPLRDYLVERTVWDDTLRALNKKHVDNCLVAKAILRLDYMNWCRDSGLEAISARQFSERLRDLGALDDGYAYNPDRDRQDRAWTGLRLRVPATDNASGSQVDIPGGPLAYQPPQSSTAESTAFQGKPQIFPDSGNPKSENAAAPAGNYQIPESGKICGSTASAVGQPIAGQEDHGTALQPPHLRVCARDPCTHTDDTPKKEGSPHIRARRDPICGSAVEGGSRSAVGLPDDPPASTRGDKLRQPPSPSEDLFDQPPPDQPPREPGDDEDVIWPPPEEPTP